MATDNIVNGESWSFFFSNHEEGCTLSPLLSYITLRLSHSNQTWERKGIQTRKKKSSKTVIADMILERENIKYPPKNY